MTLSPPLAPKRRSRRKSSFHLQDPWQWLENIDNPKTRAYLEAENSYCEAEMQPFTSLSEELYEELKSRVAEDDSSIPEQDGDYWYYVRYVKGQQYPLYCRKKGALDAIEEIYLDHNQLAAGHEFCELGFIDITSDHRYCAYGIDFEGDERYTIFVKDLFTNQPLADIVTNASSCFEWKDAGPRAETLSQDENQVRELPIAHESRPLQKDIHTGFTKSSDRLFGFFYVRLDEQDRPNTVHFHTLGTPQEQDVLVYQEADSSYFVGLDAAEDESYIFIVCHGYDASETHFHDIASLNLDFHVVRPRETRHEYDVTHHRNRFLIITNREAENYRLMWTSIEEPSVWHELLPYDPEILLEGLVVFESYWILGERYQGKPRLRIMPQDGTESFFLEYTEAAYELNTTAGRDYSSESFRFWYSSPKVPQTLYEMHVPTRKQTLLKRRNLADTSFHPDLYEVERHWAIARDGVRVPVTLIYRRDLRRSGPQALLLHGYGSYGESIDCDFSSYRLSLVDRGFVYAMAHVRGGMDLGRHWYLKGKLEHKWNSFRDFIDVTEFLIQEGWTAPKLIVAEGSSAGGLLMGVVANERPDLYLGIVTSVPFVDVLNTMLDPELPLTTLEYHEWGHPENPEAFHRIKSYSPYDNVKAQDYPHMLVVTGLHDKRVMYWEAAKWVAKLRSMKTDGNLLLFKTDMSSGHGGASGRYDALREVATELCFIVMLKQRFLDPHINV
jgi:oligopeptidase B